MTAALFLFSGLLNYAPPVFAQHISANVQGGSPSGLHRLVRDREIRIPPELGLIDESFHGTSGKTILYIQDAHDSLEAQENIAKIINHLVAHNGVKTVFEEGYEGPVPTDMYFGFIKDLELKRKVAWFFLDHLRVGGAEYAHINRAKDFTLIGADSIKLHKENINQYRLSTERKEAITQDLKVLATEVQSLASKRFPKELLEWLKLKDRFDAKQLDLFTFIERTIPLLPESTLGVKLRASGDTHRMLSWVTVPWLRFLLEATKSNDPAVIEKAKHIDAREVFGELIKLGQAIAETYLQDVTDKQLFEYRKTFSLLCRLNDLQVTQEEYETLKSSLELGVPSSEPSEPRTQNPVLFNTQGIAEFIHKQTGKPLVLSRQWERNVQDAIQFYEIAKSRDNAMEKRLDEFIKNPNETTAVLVFGGFHKENIEKILESKGIAYKVVSPRITKPSFRHEEFYQKLMTDGMFPFERPLSPVLATATRNLTLYNGMPAPFGRAEIRAVADVLRVNPETDLGTLDRQLTIPVNTPDGAQSRSEARSKDAAMSAGHPSDPATVEKTSDGHSATSASAAKDTAQASDPTPTKGTVEKLSQFVSDIKAAAAGHVDLDQVFKTVVEPFSAWMGTSIDPKTDEVQQALIAALRESLKGEREAVVRLLFFESLYARDRHSRWGHDLAVFREMGHREVKRLYSWLNEHLDTLEHEIFAQKGSPRGFSLKYALDRIKSDLDKEVFYPRDERTLERELNTANFEDRVEIIDNMHKRHLSQGNWRHADSDLPKRIPLISKMFLNDLEFQAYFLDLVMKKNLPFANWFIDILEESGHEIVSSEEPEQYRVVKKEPTVWNVPQGSSVGPSLCDSGHHRVKAAADDVAIGQKSKEELLQSLALRVNYLVQASTDLDYFTVRPASLTLASRRGNAFERANLLVAMARSLGIKAEFGLYGVDKRKWVGSLPPQSYVRLGRLQDHVVVRFTVEEDGKEKLYYADLARHTDPRQILFSRMSFDEKFDRGTGIIFMDDITAFARERAVYSADEKNMIHDVLTTQAVAEIERIKEYEMKFHTLDYSDNFWNVTSWALTSVLNQYERFQLFDTSVAESFFKGAMFAMRDGLLAHHHEIAPEHFAGIWDDPVKLNLRIASFCHSQHERDVFRISSKPFVWHKGALTIGRMNAGTTILGHSYPMFGAQLPSGTTVNRVAYTEADIIDNFLKPGVWLRSGIVYDGASDFRFVKFEKPVKVDITVYPFLPTPQFSYNYRHPPAFKDGIISEKTYRILSDKMAQAALFGKYSIPTPRTAVLKGRVTRHQADRVIKSFLALGIDWVYVKGALGFGTKEVKTYPIKENWGYYYVMAESYVNGRDKGIVLQEPIEAAKIRLTQEDIAIRFKGPDENLMFTTKHASLHKWLEEDKDLLLRLILYKSGGKIHVLVTAKPGNLELMSLARIKDRLAKIGISADRLAQQAGEIGIKIYEAIEVETGEDPVLITPDIIVDKRGKLFVLELNPGFDSMKPAHVDISPVFQDVLDDVLGHVVELARARQMAERDTTGAMHEPAMAKGNLSRSEARSKDATITEDAPFRSEARTVAEFRKTFSETQIPTTPSLKIKEPAVVVIEKERIEEMSRAELRQFMGFAVINKEKLWLVVPDMLTSQESQFLADLRALGVRVSLDLPGIARDSKVRVIGFSDKERDTADAFRHRLGQRLAKGVMEYFALENGEGLFLALLVARPEDLAVMNGFRYDKSGRYRAELRAFLQNLAASYFVISKAA